MIKNIFICIMFIILIMLIIILKKNTEFFYNKKLNCIYMWGMKPDEKSKCPMDIINNNKKYFDYSIVGRNEIEILVNKYPSKKLVNIWKNIPKWIIQADLGRLLYIYYHGGFYFDIDCEIKKDISKEINKNTILFTEYENVNPNKLSKRENKLMTLRVANYAFGSTIKNNPFIKECIELCIKRLEILKQEGKNSNNLNDTDILWVCGPDVITTVYHNSKKNNIQLLNKTFLVNKNLGSWR